MQIVCVFSGRKLKKWYIVKLPCSIISEAHVKEAVISKAMLRIVNSGSEENLSRSRVSQFLKT